MDTDFDTATLSNYKDVIIESYHLDWTISFQDQRVYGRVIHQFRFLKNATKIILDTSYLAIQSVSSRTGPLSFSLSPRVPNLGQALTIECSGQAEETLEIIIDYSTSAECTALGWLAKSSTASGLFPFFFSQCQAIHARSLFPTQDTPAIKSTYTAQVKSTLPILMSGLRISPPLGEKVPIGDGIERSYVFEQRVKIPSYLLAIAGGELDFAALGKRTGVWTEPKNLAACKWEFERDTERYLEVAEKLTSPYLWGRYDCLLLPASFPYGGMENPNITFLTPALITGDRSETDTIAHEISHSWFGNSIGCSSWSSFWLNEGWTTYLERLIVQELHGSAARDLEYIIGSTAQANAFSSMPLKFRSLHISYQDGDDPDAGFSSIPYESGSQFLYKLEKTVGGLKAWSPYMKAYLAQFTGKSISTEDWLNHFWSYWRGTEHFAALSLVDFNAWIYGDGNNLEKLVFDTTLSDVAYDLAEKWDQARDSPELRFSADDIAQFSSKQISLFLENLEKLPKFDSRLITKMAQVYKAAFGGGNSEIRVRWYFIALKGGFLATEASKWVETQGRMKYCRPIYQKINKIDHSLAVSTFLASRSFYHPIAARLIAKDLGLE